MGFKTGVKVSKLVKQWWVSAVLTRLRGFFPSGQNDKWASEYGH